MTTSPTRRFLVRAAAAMLTTLAACASPPAAAPPAPAVETAPEPRDRPGVIYVALFRPSTNFPTDVAPTAHPTFPAHAAYMEMLHDEGFVVRGGPFADLSGALLEFRLDDPAEIDGLLQEEPFVLVDVWTYTIHEWVQSLAEDE